jgi:hypothetical protein
MQGDGPRTCPRQYAVVGWWMEPGRVLAAFDAEVRRNVRPDGSGALIEAGRHVVR